MFSMPIFTSVHNLKIMTIDRVEPNSTPIGVGLANGYQRLPTEPIGTTTVIFSGVQPNSEIRVMLADGTELAGVELCTSNHVLTWAGYANGNINNNVVIRIIHPQYKIKEIDYTTVVGNITFPIQQDIDKWYKNPT